MVGETLMVLRDIGTHRKLMAVYNVPISRCNGMVRAFIFYCHSSCGSRPTCMYMICLMTCRYESCTSCKMWTTRALRKLLTRYAAEDLDVYRYVRFMNIITSCRGIHIHAYVMFDVVHGAGTGQPQPAAEAEQGPRSILCLQLCKINCHCSCERKKSVWLT